MTVLLCTVRCIMYGHMTYTYGLTSVFKNSSEQAVSLTFVLYENPFDFPILRYKKEIVLLVVPANN